MTTRADEPIANVSQARAWNGPEGAHWATLGEGATAGLVGHLVAAAGIGVAAAVLDLGCGTGDATRWAARQATGGHVLGVDLSAPMIERARELTAAAGLANVGYAVGDVQVRAFEPASFDIAISHFGTMFYADPVVAFANVRGALRPGGRLVFVCPQAMATCDWYVVPMQALLGHPPSPEETPSVMFSLADPDEVRDVLTRAGFAPVDVEPLHEPLLFGEDLDAAVDFMLGSGPVRGVLDARPDIAAGDPRRLLEEALAPYLAPDGVRLPGAHWLVSAHVDGEASPVDGAA
jgi:SAM-dependent methyltransferase